MLEIRRNFSLSVIGTTIMTQLFLAWCFYQLQKVHNDIADMQEKLNRARLERQWLREELRATAERIDQLVSNVADPPLMVVDLDL